MNQPTQKSTPTAHAIILAAGFGSRLQADEGHKLLVKIGGRTMLSWHLENFHRLGVSRLPVVTVYDNEVLARALAEGAARGFCTVRCGPNPDSETSNGLSVLAGA